MNSLENNKYKRQIILEGFGEAGQAKLKKSSVLVVGAGGLGCPVLSYLNSAGVGTIGIMDFDIVDESNLHRQILFDEEDIGKPKAIVASEKLKRQNSQTVFEIINQRLSTENVESVLKRFDVVVDCTDNFPSRYLINDACALLKIPVIYGSVYSFQGQVSVFNHLKPEKSPTLRCLFPFQPSLNEIPSCEDAGVIGILPGLIGIYQATETIKLITGMGETLNGKILCIDILTNSTNILELERNPETEKFMPANFKELRESDYGNACKIKFHISEITTEELLMQIESEKEIELIDVREINEAGTIDLIQPTRIPLNEIEKRNDEISREKKVVLFCRTGKRSSAAIEILHTRFGFNNLFNLQGGLTEWNQTIKKTQEKL